MIRFWSNIATLTVVVCWITVTSLVTREVISPTRRSLKIAQRQALEMLEDLHAQIGDDALADKGHQVALRRS